MSLLLALALAPATPTGLLGADLPRLRHKGFLLLKLCDFSDFYD